MINMAVISQPLPTNQRQCCPDNSYKTINTSNNTWLYLFWKPLVTSPTIPCKCRPLKAIIFLINSWFASMWWDSHVGVQNNRKRPPKFYITIESNSQIKFYRVVLYTNMAGMTSDANHQYVACGVCSLKQGSHTLILKSQGNLKNFRGQGI